MHRGIPNLGRIAALLALSPVMLTAQGTLTASITGDVIEKGGTPIAGALVRLTSPSLQGTRVVTTDSKGRFIARLLPPGVYSISIEKDGYQTVKTGEKLGIDQNYQPRFEMTKTAGTVVEVVAAPPAVDKTDVKTSTNYSLDAVDLLPQTRTMEGVALMTPGVTVGVGGRVQVRGAMTSGNLMLMDSQNIEDNMYADRGVSLIDDAIEETQVITGAISAEYGSVEGGVINSLSRSGGNEFHGQLRFNLSNNQWNATSPFQDRSAIPNKLNDTRTFTLGGYILKDKLWFQTSYFQRKTSAVQAITGDSVPGPGGADANYEYSIAEIRRQAKFTWLVNSEHTVVFAWMNSQNSEKNRDYGAGEIAALVPQVYHDELWNLSLRSIWSSKFTTDIRYGQKKQLYNNGSSGGAESPLRAYDLGYLNFNRGPFDANDGGDHRDNKTFNIKGSLFWDFKGTHQTDMGIDWYQGTYSAVNAQSPTGLQFGVVGVDLATRTAIPIDIWTYETKYGKAIQEVYGLYINDKWSINQNISLQIGLRYDSFKAKNEDGAKTVGASGLSPRLGLKYDLFGNSKYIFGASYAKYNGKVLEGITSKVTSQGQQAETDYWWNGPGGPQTFADIQNVAMYPRIPSNISYFLDPKLNVRLNDKMKAPSVDEIQASATYTVDSKWLGNGYVSLTYVTKTWKDLIDYRVGNDGQVTDSIGQPWYVQVWDNSPDAERKYSGLELAGQLQKGPWVLGGNITWSKLKGNYEGESSDSGPRGEGLNGWTVIDGVRAFDRNIVAPYGYLAGHVATRMRLTSSYAHESAIGKTTYGLIYQFDTGGHYSDTRSIDRGSLSPLIPSQAGDYFTQYKNNVRGMAGIFPSAAYLDLAITHDWTMFKVSGTPVRAFAKLTITNIFNHQQIIGWNTTSQAGSLTDPWQYGPRYGQSELSTYFGGARTYNLACGIRF